MRSTMERVLVQTIEITHLYVLEVPMITRDTWTPLLPLLHSGWYLSHESPYLQVFFRSTLIIV